MDKQPEISLSSLTDEQQALLDMFLEKEDFQTETTVDDKPVLVEHPEDRYKPFPLTDIQLAYVIGRSNSALSMSNVSSHGYFEFSVDNLDPERYEKAWQREIARHDMLRLVILPNGTQKVLEKTPAFHLPVNDFRGMDEKQAEEGIAAIRRRLQQSVKPLSSWPLFDVEVSLFDGHHCIIHLSLEGLFGDVKSMQIMMREIQQFYNNPETELPPLRLLFRDYVLSLENRRSMASYLDAKKYWEKRIPTLPGGPVFPTIPDSEVVAQPNVKPIEEVIDHKHWTSLQEKCSRQGLSPTSILIAAFAEVVRRWNTEENFCLNLTLFNRLPLHDEINDIIGDFTDTLFLECRASDGETFLDRALALRDRLWADLDNHQFGGNDVLRELNRYRSEKENVYMPVVFTSTFLMDNKYGASLSTLQLGGNIMRKTFNSSQTPQLLIDHQVYEDHGELHIHWDVRSEYFRRGFLEGMYRSFMDLLVRLAESDELWGRKLVAELPADQEAARKKYNETSSPMPEKLMHRLFLDRAGASPDAPCVIAGDRTLTYGEVRDRAAGVCLALRGRVKPGELVPVVIPKGWAQAVAVLGIQWAGAAYLPIDPKMPAERVSDIVESAGARFVVTVSGVEPNWPGSLEAVLADKTAPADGGALAREPDVQKPDSLAYVIYTSGSTGKPKGVMIEHRACVNTILDINARTGVTPEDRVLALSNLGFDLSVWDLFGMFAAGGAVVMPSPELAKEPAHWLELMRKHRVTLWNSVPAMMRMLTDYVSEFAPESGATLRAVLLSGDWLPVRLPETVRKLFGADVYSLGGATEASIWSIMYPVRDVDPQWSSIPYGMPLANQTYYVLGRNLEDCPCWCRGALYIGGRGLARGYFGDPEKTGAAFIIHPKTGERIYRTGDLGYFHPDGYIVIEGREDNQVKINGFRVELGDVEHAVQKLPGIADAAVMPVHEKGTTLLGAWIVPGQDCPFVKDEGGKPVCLRDELMKALGRSLPAYMVPSSYMALSALPMSQSGKTDRKHLPPMHPAEDAGSRYEAPRPGCEEKLAAIWADLLHLDRVGRDDNFFEIGGDSLTATLLIGRIHQAFNVELSVLSIYSMPVLKGMARGIGNPEGVSAGLVQTLSADGAGTPLWCVPGAEGSPVTFYDFAKKFAGENPVRCFLYPGMDGREPVLSSIEDVASRLVQEVKKAQPEGPIRLVGFCVGGFVAYAAAILLQAEGRDARCLLVDAQLLPRRIIDNELLALLLYVIMNGLPPQCISGLDAVPGLDELLKMAPRSSAAFEPFADYARLAAMDTEGRIVSLHADCTSRGWFAGMTLARFRAGFTVFMNNMRAAYAYRPLPAEKPVAFLRASENPRDPQDDPMAVWKDCRSSLAVQDVKASHMTIMHGCPLQDVCLAVRRELA